MSARRNRTGIRRTRAGGALARATLYLYPPAWRDRYADEVRSLLEDSGAGVFAAVGLAWHAARAWARPPRHLHDQPNRMRSSLATVLAAWALLAGLAVVFVQLAQAQPSSQQTTLTRHPLIGWSYWAFDGLLAASVLAAIAGGTPLWLEMLRTARSQHRRREIALLFSPVLVPVMYLAASAVIVSIVRRPAQRIQSRSVVDLANGMVGPWWFLALVAAGFAAAAAAAAGPALVLRRLSPGGAAVVLASRAAGLAAITIGLAGAASVVAVVGLYSWAPVYAGYHQAWLLGSYLPAVAGISAVAIVSATRGVLAARSPATEGHR